MLNRAEKRKLTTVMLTTGRTSPILNLVPSIVLIGGEMLVPKNENECLPYSMNQGSLSGHAAIVLSLSYVI